MPLQMLLWVHNCQAVLDQAGVCSGVLPLQLAQEIRAVSPGVQALCIWRERLWNHVQEPASSLLLGLSVWE